MPTTREKALAKGLADIASNFGHGSFSGTPGHGIMVKFRVAAADTLRSAGYVCKENPDGWYLGDKLVIPM